MRAAFLILLFAFVVPFSSARADAIFSGSVVTNTSGSVITNTPGGSCTASNTAYSALSIFCSSSSPLTTAAVKGNGDAFRGFLSANVNILENDSGVGSGKALGQLSLEDTYMLMGGVGEGTVNLNIDSFELGLANSADTSCTVTFNGASQPCDLVDQNMSFLAEYNVPFSFRLDVSIMPNFETSDGITISNTVAYALDGPGLVTTTPEPSSIWLLMPGLGGVFAIKSRARERRARGIIQTHS